MLSNKMGFCLCLILCANIMFAQAEYWIPAKKSNVSQNKLTPTLQNYELFDLEIEAFAKKVPRKGAAPSQIMLPDTNGELRSFQIWDSPIMESELEAKYPNIRTFVVQDMEDPSQHGRLSITSAGVKAYIRSNVDSYVINPVDEDAKTYAVFKKADQISTGEFKCGVEHDHAHDDAEITTRSMVQIGEDMRIFRLAVSTTGEYSDYHGGNLNDVMEAIVEAINQVNVLYENEFSLRFVIINDNELLINLDPEKDPFDNRSASQMLEANPDFINSRISEDDYDIGHVFATSGAGLASLRSSCRNRKAQAITGIFPPEGTTFAIDYVAHELGHQLGSQHTFNNCEGNEVANFAYEPGSGSTIMAYAGLCGDNNVQSSSDDYFHVSSLIQISNWIEGNGGNCAETSPTGNSVPTVAAGEGGFFIPVGTPFKLTAEGTDPDGDELTYCWEQFNLGPQSDYGQPESEAPRFRSLSPNVSPTRFFPKLSTVVSGGFNSSEVLPTTSLDLAFQCTVRDNRAGGGAAAWDDIAFEASDEAGPFVVTSQSEDTIVWESNRLATVTWDVANTDQAPINCEKVNIVLSKTLGITFDVMLAENVDNNGSHTFFVPDEAVTNFARVMVEAADNVFFNVNSERFKVVEATPTAVNQVFQNSIQIFPNPTEGTITLDMNTSNRGEIVIEVIDVQGRQIKKVESNTQLSNIELDVANGVYFLKVTQGHQLAYKKVVVTK